VNIDQQARQSFGEQVRVEGPLAASGAGLRISGVDLCAPLSPEQVTCLLDALSQYRIVSLPGQDLAAFSLAGFERFANHWGAPLPHPSNYKSGELLPSAQRVTDSVNATFPDELQCLPHESPAVLVVANIRGHDSDADRQALKKVTMGGDCWHTDIEYEEVPLWVSMFLAHKAPVSRNVPGGNWAADLPWDETQPSYPYIEGSSHELMRLRRQLPQNGETPFADTAAAFTAMSSAEQSRLLSIKVRRRIYESDEGWLVPLVRTNPRSGIKSLHSPVWASRPLSRPPVEVDGMSAQASRAFLDEIEAHVLQPEFRYDHPHAPGDVTIWDLFMTLHSFPWLKGDVKSIDDVRLLYRISCKGEPSLTLPRHDEPDWIQKNITFGYQTAAQTIEQ